ncbi:MAG: ABC transporter permease, partial [Pyrinomonadaceae bacterium]
MDVPASDDANPLDPNPQTIEVVHSTPFRVDPEPLPEQPLLVIEANKHWGLDDLRDLWAFRELLYFLTWRDVKVRYKQTGLGIAWAVVQPLLTMFIFTIFF